MLMGPPFRILTGGLFLRDKPVSAARACTKMHLPANGQSGRRPSCSILARARQITFANCSKHSIL